MADKVYPKSQLPIRDTSKLLPNIFQTEQNKKFLSGVLDPLVQPGYLDKLTGFVGRRYGNTYKGNSVYLDSDNTLRSRYQLEPGIVTEDSNDNTKFYDYLDLKNQIKFFGNDNDRDDKLTYQKHYTWNPPIDWDKFINYREYYWLPTGPASIDILGQSASIVSTYRVSQGINKAWIISPDGVTQNPTLTLYRGQTYEFLVNSPGESFTIRTNYDTGSLLFDPLRTYFPGDLAVYDGKLWRANSEVIAGDGSSIDIDTQDWDLIDSNATPASLDYNQGITNNGVENGTLIFEVPMDAPDTLYYQSNVEPDRVGTIIIADVEANTFINVEKEILGKSTYLSSNNIQFTNGLLVQFRGNVTPQKYASNTWVVEGVGESITLTNFDNLVPPVLTEEVPEVLFDNEGFDTQPFDDAAQYPGLKDYITIARNSKDSNPWSRYNRWFHRSVIEASYAVNGESFEANEDQRAKRPIIEFKPNINLFNHGITAKATVDYVDDFTKDIFSKIEGSAGYIVDGESLFDGARVLVVADTDSLANNKIYEVKFINHEGKRQVNLRETADSDSLIDECVLIRRGDKNAGSMFHYNGTAWVRSQPKTRTNQSPLFDVYDSSGVSFSNSETYPVTTFVGSPIVSYREGTGPVDSELGFSISYLNIDNVGDIQFDWNLDADSFEYTLQNRKVAVEIGTGFIKIDGEYSNGWLETEIKQPIIDSVVYDSDIGTVSLQTVNWQETENDPNHLINFYINGKKINGYTRVGNNFTFSQELNDKDVISVKVVADVEPVEGYYEIPVGLERNPLNSNINTFTLGQAISHIDSATEFDRNFQGSLPGVSNLRDLGDYRQNATRFLKHAGISSLALALVCDKNNNIIKSIRYARDQYNIFKENFIKKADEVEFNENIADYVDEIINVLTKTKNIDSPFADSDMIGSGAYTSIVVDVDDSGIKTFSLSETFDLERLSRKSVYVYINDEQLYHGLDYTFDSTFGFITINKEFFRGDRIEIREYVSTAYCHIPPTPTKMGLYKKYRPEKFLDDTYAEPTQVIQGHDGSITVAYDDFRDELLLELEKRIYNNIKVQYDPSVLDIDKVLGGYYGSSLYSKEEIENVTSQEFLRWISGTTFNYTVNDFYDEQDPFTYTYNQMVGPNRADSLPGYWRGVYKYYYDTDRPHRCPWEMVGFSEKPTWWDEEYGPAPYTSGNLILWEDLENGIIRQGSRAGVHDRYKRPGLVNHLPVDTDGELVDPLNSGMAAGFTRLGSQASFQYGDISPVEYAWKSSSDWPFSVMVGLCLLRPFDFVTSAFNKFTTETNILGQNINKNTKRFLKLTDTIVPTAGQDLSSGLVNYLTAYTKNQTGSINDLTTMIENIDVRLTSRVSGFVDKEQQKYLLDSKNPNSTSSNIFIPQENYDIIFSVSSPIKTATYSGVIVEKTSVGWILRGYDNVNPYFEYYEAIPNNKDPVIEIGGVSETFTEWTPNIEYGNGVVVEFRNDFYRSTKSHAGTDEFVVSNWRKLPKLPVVGATTAQIRKNFNIFRPSKLSYGTQFTEIQEVVDFLLGYEQYLKTQGFVFDNYDPENKVSQDWLTSCKEFMFWTNHNWIDGSIITLSPSASQVKIVFPVGVLDNILDSFYDYSILSSNGTPIDPQYINVNREFQTATITTTDNYADGIYYIKANYVLKEHVTIFSDRTVFNDVIFDKPTGYRQQRIKTQGFRTVDWDGDYTSPGFLFDNVNIKSWAPYTDYRLGDIVQYRAENYTSRFNHTSSDEFDATRWFVLDSNPTKQLIPNFDYRINQFGDYFEVGAEGIGKSQRDLARHTIGYQPREYLNSITEDSVTQFKLYQGFIREKGTANAVTKLFNKISKAQDGSAIELGEEWAFKLGTFGGSNQTREIETKFNINNFEVNPQAMLVVESVPNNDIDQYYRIPQSDFTIQPLPFDRNINPVTAEYSNLRTAGYVRPDSVEFAVRTRDDILSLDITEVKDNDHIWVTFDGPSWTVLRVNKSTSLYITDISGVTTNNTVDVYFNRKPNLSEGDIFGIKDVENLTNFVKVVSVKDTRDSTSNSWAVEIEAPGTQDPVFDVSTLNSPYILSKSRFSTYDDINPQEAALLKPKSNVWVDNNGNDQWESVEKLKQYNSKLVVDYGLADPSRSGEKVIYSDVHKQVISSIPNSGFVMVYTEASDRLSLRQILNPHVGFEDKFRGSFGKELSISPDNRFLIISSPLASGVRSNYFGPYDPTLTYRQDDTVLYEGKLWKALRTVEAQPGVELGDSTHITFDSVDWTPASILHANTSGQAPGYTQQGVISVYEYANDQWNFIESIISPRSDNNEKFGSSVAISKTATGYLMAVSAPGAYQNRGRVYLYEYSDTGFDITTVSASPSKWRQLEDLNYSGVFDPGGPKTATQLERGKHYIISDLGNTDFRFYGAEVNEIGHKFVATGPGEGTGTVDHTPTYYAGEIVWYDGNLYKNLDDSTFGDGSTISIEDGGWQRLDPVSTQSSLPQSVAVDDDGSTLAAGLLSETQVAELIKEGDQFGSSVAMNYDGSVLIIGAPFADNQWFPNYKGVWRPNYEYSENDVVKWQGNYHILQNVGATAVADGSSIRSYNQEPGGQPWVETGDSTGEPCGKVFVYKLNNGIYNLQQTISANNVINDDSANITIDTGDEFGHALAIDYAGTTMVATSPKADINSNNQGSAYIFRSDNTVFPEYRLTQRLQSFEEYPEEYFGYSVCISPMSGKVVIGANNASFKPPVFFDNSNTTFDEGLTTFTETQGFSGAVYVFDLKGDNYLLTEKLDADDISLQESFGYSIYCTDNVIAVGSPLYQREGAEIGITRLFTKDPSVDSWTIIGQQAPMIDLDLIKSVELYDNENNIKIADLEFLDHAKLKISKDAESEIKFKTLYDPAIYGVGTEDVVVDSDVSWGSKHVGQLWWDLGTAKWVHYEQGEIAFRLGNWNALAEGSSIDIYEWVETPLLPSEWSALADTNEGLAEGISGQPLYPEDTVYTVKVLYNQETQQPTETLYYYWVRNSVVVPSNVVGRSISAATISTLISNPSSSNSYIGIADTDKFIAFGWENIVNVEDALLNIEYYKSKQNIVPIHSEYQLITEGVYDSLPNTKLEEKWIDSLIGYNVEGKRVPDTDLPAKQRYGTQFRPRQSMFVDRIPALKTTILRINEVLKKEPFANSISFERLNLSDPTPSENLNKYDLIVDSNIDLETVGTVRITQAILSANIIDGVIDTIDIVNPGYGYKVAPPIILDGDGINATASCTIDNQGRINTVTVNNGGKKYSTVNVKVREFSVLVKADETANGSWGIYAWDNVRKSFYRSDSQDFDTTKYWQLIDWWAEGFSNTSRVVKEINIIGEEPSISIDVGDLIRVKEYGSGGWAVFRKDSDISQSLLDNYTLVGRQAGTIELSGSLYDSSISGSGYDTADPFDIGFYDIENANELRIILEAVKHDIFIGDYAVEWNLLFFASIRYVFKEQTYVDWAFKTSFLNAIHNVGPLEQKINYKNDSLESFNQYLDEVKPYHTTIREYTSRYTGIDNANTAITDFDLPPYYSVDAGKVIKVDVSDPITQEYPYKFWSDNNTFSLKSIEVYEQGSGYVNVPRVIIDGDGTGAKAQAYVSNGKVVAVKVTAEGAGYTKAPTVSLVGGNGNADVVAKASAIIGDTKARTFNVSVKFDRLSKEGFYNNFNYSQEFIAPGTTAVFELAYAPDRDKSKIKITKNNQIVLNSDYKIDLYKSSTDTFSLLKGKITFSVAPTAGDVIEITYDKNDELLDSVNRIQKYYSPVSGMEGNELSQLMTGIDFGGVQVQGTTFDVTGGWDALPWFTDSWDSVEAASDYYVVCDGSTNVVTLPFTPADGQEINVYLKREGEEIPGGIIDLQYEQTVPQPRTIRIDDPNWDENWDSTNQTNPSAEMPTFYGDGETNIIEIGKYITTRAGDILIFRPADSDGSVVINDPNIIDTKLSGGTLSAIDQVYQTATGKTVDEIVIDGETFISPDQVPAPEENVPGQVLDSVSIKVFQSTREGTAPLRTRILKGNGTTSAYDIGQEITESNSVIVYVNKVRQTNGTDYNLNLISKQVEFVTPPALDSNIEIISIGLGGLVLLDYEEYIADNETTLFLTRARYDETAHVFISVNGQEFSTGFVDSTEFSDTPDLTMVQFANPPALNDVIKIVVLGERSPSGNTSLIRLNTQSEVYDGSTTTFTLSDFYEFERGSVISSVIVEVADNILIGTDTEVYTVEDQYLADIEITDPDTDEVIDVREVYQFEIGKDPSETAGSILPSNLKVFVNGIEKTFIQDFVYNGTTKIVQFNKSSLTDGDEIKIENDFRAEYSISGNEITINKTMSEGDSIEITWFNEYPSMEIVADEYTGGKVNFPLRREALSSDYVWVYKNGARLTQDKDYTVSLPRGVVYMTEITTASDKIKIVVFGNEIFKLPAAYEIHKDMLNIYHYNRYAKGVVTLAKDLTYYDTSLEVSDGTLLADPVTSKNIPGVIEINKERIEYLSKNGNVLSQLRRGTQGTAINEIISSGVDITDLSAPESIPYNDRQEKETFVGDGSSSLIGPLNFVPEKTTVNNWYRNSIPEEYGQCNTIEVFVGGTRLRKMPIEIYDETLSATSPAGDKQVEAEFSVDGTSNYIRLSTPPAAGTRITVIKKVGNTWYDRGATTATTGVTLLENNTSIAKFIAQKSSELPE